MSPASAHSASAEPEPAVPPLADPRAVLHRHRRPVVEPNPAAERIERLLAVQGEWLHGRLRTTARHFRLDPNELCQELMLSMLRRSTMADEGNRGVRSWLGSRVDWTAQDMLRRRGREETVSDADLEAIERGMVSGSSNLFEALGMRIPTPGQAAGERWQERCAGLSTSMPGE